MGGDTTAPLWAHFGMRQGATSVGLLPRDNPLLGTFTHAPASGARSAYFKGSIVSTTEQTRRVWMRHNPYTAPEAPAMHAPASGGRSVRSVRTGGSVPRSRSGSTSKQKVAPSPVKSKRAKRLRLSARAAARRKALAAQKAAQEAGLASPAVDEKKSDDGLERRRAVAAAINRQRVPTSPLLHAQSSHEKREAAEDAPTPLLPAPALAGQAARKRMLRAQHSFTARTARRKGARTASFTPMGVAPAHKDVNADYEIREDKMVGEGAFGKIRPCRRRQAEAGSGSGSGEGDGWDLVVKIVKKKHLYSAEERESIVREAHIHKGLLHKHIVKLHDVYESAENVYMVMERVRGLTLHQHMRYNPCISEPETAALMKQLLLAVGYLHDRGIVHADIKPQNLLLIEGARGEGQTFGKFPTLKLCDFGTAQRARDARYHAQTGSVTLVPFSTVTGTMGFVAPEVLRRQPYGTAIDMWAVGILLYEMLAGFSPFYPYSTCIDEDVQFSDRYWKGINPDVQSLVRGLLQRDPAKRITAAQALEHPWLVTALGLERDPVVQPRERTRSVAPTRKRSTSPPS